MEKKYLGIIALVIVCLGFGGYYALTQRASDVSVDSTTSVATSTSTTITTEMSSDPDSSYVADNPDSPYTLESDEKLHLYKGVTLDPEIITIDHELKDVELCGNIYKTKQIFIDGVDVVQRLAQLFQMNPAQSAWYCTKLINRVPSNDRIISSHEELTIIIDQDGHHYAIALYLGTTLPNSEGGYPAWVNPEENRIEGLEGYYFGTLR